MNFRDDLAKWRFKKLGLSYDAVAKSAKLSVSTVWDLCSDKGNPGDPNASTLKALFKGLGLKPEYALNFQLKKSDFRLAVNGAKAGRRKGGFVWAGSPLNFGKRYHGNRLTST